MKGVQSPSIKNWSSKNLLQNLWNVL